MGFLYYLPAATVATVDRDALRMAGLQTALRDCLETQLAFQERLILHQVHANGPDPERRSGVLVLPQPPDIGTFPARIGYYPAEQQWVPVKLVGSQLPDYWLGWALEHRPTPASLARAVLVSGYDEVLGDGQTWHCPTIRRQGAFPNLPRGMGVDAAGEFTMRILPRFDWAWELSGEIWDKVFGAPALAFAEAYRLAVLALSLNYRVGPQEVSQLGLITTENFQRVFEAAIDWPLVKELLATEEDQKKSAAAVPADSSVSAGSAGGCPTTDPAAANCIS